MLTTLVLLTGVLLLALVAGLLVVAVLELRTFKTAVAQLPLLGADVAGQLVQARTALEGLKKEVGSAIWASQVSEAGKLKQDLEYLLARADKMAAQLEQQTAAQSVRAPAPQAQPGHAGDALVAADVAQSNLAGLESLQTPAAKQPDPLEQLLATLAQSELVQKNPAAAPASNNVVKLPGKAKKPRALSQAELDLHKSLAG